MIRFSCLAESKTPPDLLDTISEIKWMEVLKSISAKKNFMALFLGSLPQIPASAHAILLFFGIV